MHCEDDPHHLNICITTLLASNLGDHHLVPSRLLPSYTNRTTTKFSRAKAIGSQRSSCDPMCKDCLLAQTVRGTTCILVELVQVGGFKIQGTPHRSLV
ncbi:hypothetical protein VNO77_42377 [Canavalia gladiata]|uniref:Uncharacterized protein n=1 Tax=Canavalia gladiata TaxID=3824 RepID=A0AAN9PSC6_CANGL